MKYIDAHVHVWTNQFDRYPLSPPHQESDMNPKTFYPEELLAHAEPSGVNRIVLIQMSYYQFDNTYMLDVMEAYPGVFSGIAIVDWEAEKTGSKRCYSLPIKVSADSVSIRKMPPSKIGWTDPDLSGCLPPAAAHNLAICPLINPNALPALSSAL